MNRSALALMVAVLVVCAGCVNVFSLPDPPPESERKDISLIPGEEARQAERDYLQARAAVLTLFGLLQQQRYAEAKGGLSIETQDFIRFGSEDDVADILAAGEMKLPDGKVVSFEAVSMLLAEDVSQLTDTFDGVEEQETANRKEIFAVQPSGDAVTIVVIKESGGWVLHRTRLPSVIKATSE